MVDSPPRIARIVVALVVWLLPAWSSAAPPQAPAPVARPVVVRADVDQIEPDRLVIRGKHFGVGTTPTVLLAKTALDVLSFSDEQIVARLPLDAPAARYELQVLANGKIPSRIFEVRVGRRPDHAASAGRHPAAHI
jgi:hypothetical protein